MEDLSYIGEHLLPGKLGHFLLILGFVSAILSMVGYGLATHRAGLPDRKGWLRIGQVAYLIKSLSAFSAIAIIFYLMINQYYEYEYVQAHVAEELPFKYIFTAFWEGQQGSFLLWIFWHAVLGMLLMRWAKDWEAPTMAVLASIQAFLLSMILGIYLTPDFRLGVTPFALLREVEGMAELPLFANANYVDLIRGKGLNPLLQNYWMLIHPPTLFLGFASTTIPFAYAVAGFWTGRYQAWLKPVMPWSLFSVAILGTGILMGGAWAYEALSFGGYWAWDPVENASFVPWLILVAGVHMNLVAKSTGHSIKGTYVFYILTFLFILYSTFLTRSGILGDSSVHAFTEMGLEWQLVLFMGFYVLMSGIQYFRHRKKVPVPIKEEALSAREFWMFLGSLVLLFSAGLITFTTSLPVINKLMDVYGSLVGQDVSGWHMASPEDPIAHYNKYQLWISLFVGLLSGATQFLIYKEKNWALRKTKFWRSMGISLASAAVFTFLLSLWINTNGLVYVALIFSATFAISANVLYLITVLKLKLKSAAAVIAHVGFGLMILGILASGLNKKYISNNAFAMQGIFSQEDERLHRNVFLIKNQPLFMGGYRATYVSDTMIDLDRYYQVSLEKLGEDNQSVVERFELEPYLTYNTQKTEMVNPNPSTKRYLHKDLFSHITWVPAHRVSVDAAREEDDSLDYKTYLLGIRDTLTIDGINLHLENIILDPVHPEYTPADDDLAYGLEILAWNDETPVQAAYPVLAIKEQKYIYSFYDQLNELGVRLRLTEDGLSRIYPDENDLNYVSFTQKQGDIFNFDGYQIRIAGFDKNPTHSSYEPEEGDIAVAILLEIITPEGREGLAKPIFLIRDNRTYLIKDYQPNLGLSTKFASIDPATESMQLLLAKTGIQHVSIPVQVATQVPRDDCLVLEVIEFPGINLFWLGSIMMMGGATLGMFRRRRWI